MPHPTPAVTIELDRSRTLRLTLGGARGYEDQTGQSLLLSEVWGALGYRDLRGLLWTCLVWDEPALTVEMAGALVDGTRVPEIRSAVMRACELSMPEEKPKDQEGEEPPKVGGAGLDWLNLWAIGRHDLGLSDAEFWSLTFREFDALCQRHEVERERADYRANLPAAVVASTLANIHCRGKEHPGAFSVEDFMPTKQPKERRVQTPEDQLAIVKVLNAAFGGDIVEVYDSPAP